VFGKSWNCCFLCLGTNNLVLVALLLKFKEVMPRHIPAFWRHRYKENKIFCFLFVISGFIFSFVENHIMQPQKATPFFHQKDLMSLLTQLKQKEQDTCLFSITFIRRLTNFITNVQNNSNNCKMCTS